MVKFSFVIPIHKKPLSLLKDCVNSLLDQSHKDIEIIAVFDGGDDVLESFINSKKSVKKVVLPQRGGACRARNEGFKHATGDFVSFWDADCIAEPEMTAVWQRYLELDPSLDFVYSGYKWLDPSVEGFPSEPFDPFTLERYNYIPPMFPCRREKVVPFDPDLKSLQDWDYWRRIVKNGSKGEHIPGFGFATEISGKDSISGSVEEPLERINVVRKKHSDPRRAIHVMSRRYWQYGLNIAKILDADIFNGPYWYHDDYKMVIMVGFDALDVISNKYFLRKTKAKKAIYWVGFDAEKMHMEYPFRIVKGFIGEINKYVHRNFCDDKRTQEILKDMGIKADILPFPRVASDTLTTMPEKFKVLVHTDRNYAPLFDSLRKAMPDIDMTFVEPEKHYKIEDYSLVLQFTVNKRLEVGTKNMLLCGRYVLSNVQEPYCGYISTTQRNMDEFKDEIIEKIREIRRLKAPNTKAQEYYLGAVKPERFKDKICALA